MIFSLLPRTILEIKSPISGNIKVVEQLGKYRLHVGEMLQSGGILEGVWKKALSSVKHPRSNILILGLGGGTVARLAAVKWPGVKIIGVEIDPIIIKLGKKFFGLNEIPGLEIVIDDADDWVKQAMKERTRFDLIIVDVYLKDEIPQECKTPAFLNRIKRLLSKNGVAIFNQLLVKKKKKEAEKATEDLKKLFPQVELVKTSTNLFVLASTKPF